MVRPWIAITHVVVVHMHRSCTDSGSQSETGDAQFESVSFASGTRLLNADAMFLFSAVTSAAEYYGKYLGPFKSYHHGLGGDVYAVDARTLHIRNFVYDGEGPGKDILRILVSIDNF